MTSEKKRVPQVQHVFLHCCATPEDPAHLCKRVSTSFTVRVPHDITFDIADAETWRNELELRLWQVPAPYSKAEETVFWNDLFTFLAASIAAIDVCNKPCGQLPWPEKVLSPRSQSSSTRVGDKDDMSRFPAILLTDSQKLCRLLMDFTWLQIVAEVARLPVHHLLPVILLSSFKQLCGGLSGGEPLEAWSPFPDGKLLAAKKSPRRFESKPSTVDVGLGVYVQKRSKLASIDKRFGARAFMLFGDGTCTYFAVSPDGARGVRACGNWDVINGLLVLGCASNDVRPVQIDLNQTVPQALDDEFYDEPLYLALEDIPTNFDGPLPFAEILPKYSRNARAQLLEDDFANKFEELCHHEQSADAIPSGEKGKHKPGPRPTGLLRPGEYVCNDDSEFKKIKIVLHAEGSYTYTEASDSGFITPRIPTRLTLWHVVDQVLILTSKDGSLTFVLQKAKNSRTVEQHMQCVKIPVSVLLDRFVFTTFKQETEPFSGHISIPEKSRFGGLLDPLSAALQDPEIENDRMPLKDFEKGLERSGILAEAGTSSLNLLQGDENGDISVKELKLLDNSVDVASPEQMEELRQAILAAHGTLHEAFSILAGSMQNSMAPYDFDQELRREDEGDEGKLEGEGDEGKAEAEAPAKTKASKAEKETAAKAQAEAEAAAKAKAEKNAAARKLKEFVDKTNADQMRRVFNALDVGDDGVVDWADFQTLHYAKVVQKIRLVDHFIHFIRNNFRKGNSDDCFKRAFEALNIRKAHGSGKEFLDKDELVVGVTARLGYPHKDVARFIFSLVDRNFNFKITMKEFGYLNHFDSYKFLDDLARFKNLVDVKCGGLDRCYKKLLLEEARLTGHPEARSVKASTFETFFRKQGIKPQVDLRTMFIFMEEATGSHASGYISESEWAILKGFDPRITKKFSSKLSQLIKSKYGRYPQCFQQLYSAWLPQEISDRLDRLALTQAIVSCGFAPEASDGKSVKSPPVSVMKLPARQRAVNPGEALGVMQHPRSALTDWNYHPRPTVDLPIRQCKLPGILSNVQDGSNLGSGRGGAKTSSAIEWGRRSKLDAGHL